MTINHKILGVPYFQTNPIFRKVKPSPTLLAVGKLPSAEAYSQPWRRTLQRDWTQCGSSLGIHHGAACLLGKPLEENDWNIQEFSKEWIHLRGLTLAWLDMTPKWGILQFCKFWQSLSSLSSLSICCIQLIKTSISGGQLGSIWREFGCETWALNVDRRWDLCLEPVGEARESANCYDLSMSWTVQWLQWTGRGNPTGSGSTLR